jgi:hypothetical protein
VDAVDLGTAGPDVAGTPGALAEQGGRRRRSAAVALFVVLFYVLQYPIRGFHIALGSDTPVYVWWSRRTGVAGMRSLLAGGRPGVVGVMAALSDLTRVSAAGMATVMAPVLAAALALAMGSFADLGLGRDRDRFLVVSVFTGAFVSLLAAGYFATLAFAAMFVAGLALLCLAGRDGAGRWAVVAGAALLFTAAGMAQPLFIGLGGILVLGGLVALFPATVRQHRAGVSWTESAAARVTLAMGAGMALTAWGVVALGPNPRVPIDTSRDAILRRVGLVPLSHDSYRKVFHRFFPVFRLVTVVGLSGLALLRGRSARARSPRGSLGRAWAAATEPAALFWGVMMAWLLVTAAGVAALFVGFGAPGQRLMAFCLALPALAAVGVLAVRDRLFPARPRLAEATLVTGAVAFLVVGWLAWAKEQPLITTPTLRQFTVAGGVLRSQAPGTPLILIDNDRTASPGLTVARYGNYLRDSVPPERIPDLLVFVGSPGELIDARLVPTGLVEHDRIAATSLRRVRGLIGRHPLVVVLQNVDPSSFGAALRSIPPTARSTVGPGVIAFRLGAGAPAPTGSRPLPGTGSVSSWLPVGLAPAVLALLWIAGWGWARAALPARARDLVPALAPACGLAALAIAGMAVDWSGLRLAKGGGVVAYLVATAGGWAAAYRSRGASPRAAAPQIGPAPRNERASP